MAIFRRKDKDGNGYGSYRISVYKGIDEKTGKKDYYWETFTGNIQQARERETKLKFEQQQGILAKPGKLTVGDFLDQWLNDYVVPNLSPTVIKNYRFIINNHMKPRLGKIVLTSLNRQKIDQYYSDILKTGLKAQTVRHHHTLLHKALESAIGWNLLNRNPAHGIKPPRVQKVEMLTYEPHEVVKFLDQAKTTEYYAMFHLAFHEGLRRSELLGLRWKDVDLVFGTVSVNRAMHMMKGREIVYRQTKTTKSTRSIPFTPSSYGVIKDHYDKCKDILKQIGKNLTDDDLVFQHLDTGEPYRPDNLTKSWSRIAKIANLKHIRLHDARHTMATIMLKMGIHPKIVQERLGHSSIQITLDTYSHVTPTMQLQAAKSFDEAFNSTYNNKVETEKTSS